MLGTTDKEGEPGGWGGVLTWPQEAAEIALGMRGCLGSPVWDTEQAMLHPSPGPAKELGVLESARHIEGTQRSRSRLGN